MRPKEKDESGLKITNQCRVVGGMAYGLTCRGVLLTLHVTSKTSDDDPGEWRVEARGHRPPEESYVAAEWGATRAEALRSVGRSWDEALEAHGLSMFDWEAVARVLGEVRAI